MFKKDKKIDLGKPIKNFIFKLICAKTDFKASKGENADLLVIKMFAKLISEAETFLLDGKFLLTDRNFLIRGNVEGLPLEEIVIDVDDAGPFANLAQAAKGERLFEKMYEWDMWPHIHSQREVKHIRFDRKIKQFILD